jgi:hypothetical protein
MSVLSSFLPLWSQAAPSGIPVWLLPTLKWLFLLGEPGVTRPDLWGSLIDWFKVVSLVCLVGWVVSWLVAAFKERLLASGSWLDIAALLALVGAVVTVLLNVLEATGRLTALKLGPIAPVTVLGVACGAVLFVWAEAGLWRVIRRLGQGADLAVLLGVHAALLVGILAGMAIQQASLISGGAEKTPWYEGMIYGVRLGATYMGYVVLTRVAWLVLGEVVNVRFRRLLAIARLSVIESNRRMWAPWVVITVFLVILAFAHWFLQPPRPAEMGRLFVGAVTFVCSLLLIVMVAILTPLSLPQDIQHQTIYTVVSKPVRRLELIWGRMIGFMAIVTVLVLVFGGISLLYLSRNVGGAIEATRELARKEAQQGRMTQARQLREQADQLQTRMSARVPVKGSLTFLDSYGNPHFKGIDVGMEQSLREPRSHIEGATPATAIWNYGVFPDPYNPRLLMDRRIPVALLVPAGSIEGMLDQVLDLRHEINRAVQEQKTGNLAAAAAKQLETRITRNREELAKLEAGLKGLEDRAAALESQARDAEAARKPTEAAGLRREAAALHAPEIPVEVTFNVYRTTKGKVGEPVYAEIQATNPVTGFSTQNYFAVREYYTNKQFLHPRLLAGSHGALKIEIRCISPTQYLGMAESDLYILVQKGNFGANFMKGLFGVWLQAMVLTAIGVFAGTFLSWPVALLTTVTFAVAGYVAFAFLLSFAHHTLLGGGPFESLVRLLTHANQMTDLEPTVAVVTAKTLDALVMPVMSRLVYIVPNFTALDVSNTVANGFAVSGSLLVSNLLLTLAYVLPFSIAGYFILKNREVAA